MKSLQRRLPALAGAAGFILVISTSFHAAASEEGKRKTRAVALVGDAAPGGGTFSGFDEPMVNKHGAVAFQGFLAGDGAGIYLSKDWMLTKIAKTGDEIEDFGTLTGTFFDGPAINNADTVAFVGSAGSNSAVLQKELDQPVDVLAQTGQCTPDGLGTFVGFDDISQNNNGDVAFIATYRLKGETLLRAGVFKFSEGTVTTIVKDGDALPGTWGGTLTANATLTNIDEPWIDGPWINDKNAVAFQPESIHNALGLSDSLFIKPHDEEIRPLVLIGSPFEDGTVESINLGRPALSNEFVGMKVNNSLATRELEDDAEIRSCVKTGDTPPAAPAGYEFEGFQAPALGEDGTLAFSATVALPGPGDTEINPTDNIYTCEERKTRAVALQGDARPRPATGFFGSLEEASIGGFRVTFIDEGSPSGVYVSAPSDD